MLIKFVTLSLSTTSVTVKRYSLYNCIQNIAFYCRGGYYTLVVKKVFFILLAVYSLFFILGGFSAPILAYFKIYDLSGAISYLFSGSCHQMPDRSFWIMGYPMAICSRCLGIYTGSFFTCVTKAIRDGNIKNSVLIFILLLAATDIVLNFFFAVNTGIYCRFVAGIFIGILFVEYIERLVCFVINKNKKRKG